jgi:hypothetical protein
VVLFLASLAESGLSAATLRQFLSSLRGFRKDLGLPPLQESGTLQRLLDGVERAPLALPTRVRPQRLPVTVPVLRQLRPLVAFQQYECALYWTAAVVAVFGMLRSGEVAPVVCEPAAEYERRVIRRRHLFMAVDGQSMAITLPVSKTDPLGHGVRVPYFLVADSSVCPCRTMLAFLQLRDRLPGVGGEDSPLFVQRDGKPLQRGPWLRAFGTWLAASTVDGSTFNGHSFRRGGAQSLQAAGVPIEELKKVGRWKSSAVEVYLVDSGRSAAALTAARALSAHTEAEGVVPSRELDRAALVDAFSSQVDGALLSVQREAVMAAAAAGEAVAHRRDGACVRGRARRRRGWGTRLGSSASSSSSSAAAVVVRPSRKRRAPDRGAVLSAKDSEEEWEPESGSGGE